MPEDAVAGSINRAVAPSGLGAGHQRAARRVESRYAAVPVGAVTATWPMCVPNVPVAVYA
jgi:hypothetical protein